ncbi:MULTISPECIES: hypothetical protein [Burkholderia]|uniref:hypothetical protein n=1 Tax=Burkholderia TaxID=32008 RepID=UPI000B79B09F|nr:MULTISPECIES: hypothetical protein [Burkholderia]MBJ9693670.1 hypothetical protein [Burkholderia cenocepacia]MDN7614078.1 hypothetical protein [Burkholderia cepacia]
MTTNRQSLPPNAGKGRKPGVPNKTTQACRDALVEAFDKLGGVAALVKFGKADPAAFYKIWSKLLPREIKAEVTDLTREERLERLKELIGVGSAHGED